MNLKDFVAGSLTQIIEGIRKAQEEAAETGAWISPAGSSIPRGTSITVINTPAGDSYLQQVQFDVAVTVSDEQSAGAGGGLRVFGAKIGAEGEVNYKNAAVSRVQFTVPVVWPGQTQPELEKKLEDTRRNVQERARRTQRRSGGPNSWMKGG
jgi:hypothetical protein